ncbi:hypothetical protein BBJ28_00023597 [Nothophytophthora sp. Chile5]|nr:hypothetical protein BBJ28_00023597 [Nothophytophthora sp. Chile5]
MTSALVFRALRSALRRPLPRHATRGLSSSRSAFAPASSSLAAARDAAPPVPAAPAAPLALLERSIALRQSAQALNCLAQLETPPSPLVLQKLAVLLTRQKKSRAYTMRAFEILRGVYRGPGLTPDDYTKLASIYVLDACLRFRLLDQAMEVGSDGVACDWIEMMVYEEAVNQDVVLDLPAYDALLTALLDAKRLDDAADILREVVGREDVCPTEKSFLPVLKALVKTHEYDDATEIMRQGLNRGVEFTVDTYLPILTITEKHNEPTDSFENFMSFIENAWSEYKMLDGLDDDDLDDLDEPEEPEDPPSRS